MRRMYRQPQNPDAHEAGKRSKDSNCLLGMYNLLGMVFRRWQFAPAVAANQRFCLYPLGTKRTGAMQYSPFGSRFHHCNRNKSYQGRNQKSH